MQCKLIQNLLDIHYAKLCIPITASHFYVQLIYHFKNDSLLILISNLCTEIIEKYEKLFEEVIVSIK